MKVKYSTKNNSMLFNPYFLKASKNSKAITAERTNLIPTAAKLNRVCDSVLFEEPAKETESTSKDIT